MFLQRRGCSGLGQQLGLLAFFKIVIWGDTMIGASFNLGHVFDCFFSALQGKGSSFG